MTVLLVEQNAQRALDIADYGYIMENGRVVLDGTAQKLAANADVQEFYLGVSAVRRARACATSSTTSAARGGCHDRPCSRSKTSASVSAACRPSPMSASRSTPGEICSVIGPNGAGKTTLFNMITGVLRPSGGRILFDGIDLATVSPSRFAASASGAPSRTWRCSSTAPWSRTS